MFANWTSNGGTQQIHSGRPAELWKVRAPPACTVFSHTAQDRKQWRTDRLSVTSQFVLAKGDKFTLLFTPTGNFEFLSSDLRVSGLWEENDRGSRKHIQTD